eukprot:TRINITY_DN804_c0_g1_i2.p1 TRINITY_DN804_c0_g1~~TRINITY_DN804_c0_g1_i2.p1  ORF type:complete len:273 (+),score=61.88 TRINITY_DN804_c0_g1_i2:86-904(+)
MFSFCCYVRPDADSQSYVSPCKQLEVQATVNDDGHPAWQEASEKSTAAESTQAGSSPPSALPPAQEEVPEAAVASPEAAPEAKPEAAPVKELTPAQQLSKEPAKGDLFIVELELEPGQAHGLEIDNLCQRHAVVYECLFVSAIKNWNDTCHESKVVRKGDLLSSVNNIGGFTDDLIGRMKGEKLKLCFKHSINKKVTIKKNGGSLGLGFTRAIKSVGLNVSSMSQNGAARPSGIRVGDRIIGVNGQHLSQGNLLELIKQSADTVELEYLTWP